jgi:hypothetical protein
MRPRPPKVGPELLVGGNFELTHGARKIVGLAERAPGPTRVLVIEQYTHSHTDQLLETIEKGLKASGEDAQLMLRMHPRSIHLKKPLVASLQARGVKVEVDRASAEGLYTVLERSDVVVVESSTVAHEASAVGRHVVVYGDVGRKFFATDIGSGAFRFASSVADIAPQIREAMKGEHKPSDFFNMDPTGLSDAIARLQSLAEPNT